MNEKDNKINYISLRDVKRIYDKKIIKKSLVDNMIHNLSAFVIMWGNNVIEIITKEQKEELRIVLKMYEKLLKDKWIRIANVEEELNYFPEVKKMILKKEMK